MGNIIKQKEIKQFYNKLKADPHTKTIGRFCQLDIFLVKHDYKKSHSNEWLFY